MNNLKYLKQIIKLMAVLLFLAGCTKNVDVPTLSPTLPASDSPPTALPTSQPTPTISVLIPGSKIGQMSIEISSSFIPNWLDYCIPVFSDQPGGGTIDCDVALMPELKIGAAWGAKDEALLNSSWKELTWELYVDNQPVDLNAFGTYDFGWSMEGKPAKFRAWNVKLVNLPAGEHTLRYVYRINQEVDNGFSITQPGVWEAVVNLNLSPSTTSPTAADSAPLTSPQAWWNSTVFYEVFVRSFADSNSGPLANDGIGDLQGLIEKLDYLNDGDPTTTDDLGVTGIWLMPIMPSPSYHGYDVTDYYSVNEDYGTSEDFKHLLAEAHERGIKIIIDLVVNHTSSEHPWFIEARANPESEYRDWYIWSDVNPAYAGPWGQIVWHASASGYYYGLFWSGMPDLNYENPQVREEMENVTRFWLEDVGVDGFRLDAARHLIEEGSIQENTKGTHEWLKRFRTVYKASNPEAMTVGEIWTENVLVISYLRGDELDLAFDFNLAEAIVAGVMARDAGRIQKALTSSYNLFGNSLSATFLTNHDMNRVMSQLGKDFEKGRLAAAVLMTTPGVPFIYYGEEIGMTGVKPDELIRTPMQWSAEDEAGFTTGIPWEAVNPDYSEKNVAAQLQDPGSLLSLYRELIRIRNDHPALQAGGYSAVDSEDSGILAFLRTSQDERVLVVINLGEEAVSAYNLSLNEGSLTGSYESLLLYGGQAELPGLTANDLGGFDSYQPLPEIPGSSLLIIQLKPTE